MHNESQKSFKNAVIAAAFLLILIITILFVNSLSQVSASADDASGESADQLTYMPIVRLDPTSTPNPIIFQDDFSDPTSGWPVVDNTFNPSDCYKWEYVDGIYRSTICDDRTDVKASPGIALPNGDYEITFDARFINPSWSAGIYWSAYGLLFDAKDDPDPDNADLGDYYMLWILYDGNQVLWQILNDFQGGREQVTDWNTVPSDKYNYSNDGESFNRWRVVRTETKIDVYINDKFLATVSASRPRTNNQIWFGIFTSTYEFSGTVFEFDNYMVRDLSINSASWYSTGSNPTWVSGDFNLEPFLPQPQE